MKVLVLTEHNESSRYWEAALPLLKEKGIEIWLATVRGKGQLHENLAQRGIPTESFDARKAIDYPRVVYKLAKFVRREQFDIIHASESLQSVIGGAVTLVNRRTICIFHCHHAFAAGKQKLLGFFGSHLAHRIMAVSGASKTAVVEDNRVSAAKVSVAYNGINRLRKVSPTESAELRRGLKIPENAKVIVAVARLRKIKGHETLFKAFRAVAANSDFPVHLVLVGDGEESESLKNLAAQMPECKIHFAGHQEDVSLWFSAADIAVLPSLSEAMPLSAVEAMSLGKALVASAVGGLLEIIEDGKNGLLVPPQDEKALAVALKKALNSPALAEKLGANARRRVEENFTVEKMVDGWIGCYDFALKQIAGEH